MTQYSDKPFGIELANAVADRLDQGDWVCPGWRDASGMGLAKEGSTYIYAPTQDGRMETIEWMARFQDEKDIHLHATREAFVDWLKVQSDESLSRDGQSVTRDLLRSFAKRDTTNLGKVADTIDASHNVVIATRWHQTGTIAALLLPLTVFMVGNGIDAPSETLIFAACICFALPLLLAWVFFPPLKDVMHVEADAIVGKRYGRIPMSDITTYNVDDYIKLHRKGRCTLLLQGSRGSVGFQDLMESVVQSLNAWRAQHPDSILQTHFYGTLAARQRRRRWIGMIILPIIIVGLGVWWAKITPTRDDNAKTCQNIDQVARQLPPEQAEPLKADMRKRLGCTH